ncbi:hypothetical protein HDU76_006526, partial [Blyttiomyces sp. JEL0837]
MALVKNAIKTAIKMVKVGVYVVALFVVVGMARALLMSGSKMKVEGSPATSRGAGGGGKRKSSLAGDVVDWLLWGGFIQVVQSGGFISPTRSQHSNDIFSKILDKYSSSTEAPFSVSQFVDLVTKNAPFPECIDSLVMSGSQKLALFVPVQFYRGCNLAQRDSRKQSQFRYAALEAKEADGQTEIRRLEEENVQLQSEWTAAIMQRNEMKIHLDS